ncbi:transposase [Paraburkholderia sacchari]
MEITTIGVDLWARKLQALGHTVKLMAPQFVKPYVKSNKNDAADAEAICEAVGRPSMRFVPIKNIEQQSVLSLHRVRQGFVKARGHNESPARISFSDSVLGTGRLRQGDIRMRLTVLMAMSSPPIVSM